MRTRQLAAAATLAGWAFTACNDGANAPAASPSDQAAPVVEKAEAEGPKAIPTPSPAPPAEARTVEVTAEAAARGKVGFAVCAGCHGQAAEGVVGVAPRLASETFLAAASDAMLIETITKGRAGTTMVPWGGSMKPEQIADIVAWLRHETPTEAAALDHGPLKGEVARGEKLFGDICARCHGNHGGGYQEAGSGTGIGRRAFLVTATDGFLRYIIRHGKSATAMRPFSRKSPTAVANLDAGEIEDIITYMRQSAW